MNDNRINEYNVYEESKKRKKYIIAILVTLIALGIGYAYLQTLLNISGTAKVSTNTWNVYWDEDTLESNVSNNLQVTQMPKVESDKTTITYNITLDKPGDFAEFTIDAHNGGSIDAMIASVTKKVNGSLNIPDYLDYSVSYADGSSVLKKQILRAETAETYKVRVEYKKDIEPTELPGELKELNCTLDVDYVQADNTAKEIRSIVYSVSETPFTLGQAIPNGETPYVDKDLAISDFTQPLYVKHNIGGDLVLNSAIILELGTNIYTFNIGSSNTFYEDNEATIKRIFGENFCPEYTEGQDWTCASSIPLSLEISNNVGLKISSGVGDPSYTVRRYCIAKNGQTHCGIIS